MNSAERPLTFSDMDGDGYGDLIVFLSRPDASIKDRPDNYKMAVYSGTKNGTFNTRAMEITIPPHLNIPRSKLTFQKTADVNGDGIPDIVSLSQDGFIQTILGHQNGLILSDHILGA